jgi:hypothetical protein
MKAKNKVVKYQRAFRDLALPKAREHSITSANLNALGA